MAHEIPKQNEIDFEPALEKVYGEDSIVEMFANSLEIIERAEPELITFLKQLEIDIKPALEKVYGEDKVDEIVIRFDANEVTYKRSEWNKITLAYCCSIHKSQGSEFKMVILPMVKNYHRMLRRDLTYTAITRASELLILCGEPQAFHESVMKSSADRLTTLKERIMGEEESIEVPTDENATKITVVPESKEPVSSVTDQPVQLSMDQENESPQNGLPKEYKLTISKVNNEEVDPMIGMEGVTPYQ